MCCAVLRRLASKRGLCLVLLVPQCLVKLPWASMAAREWSKRCDRFMYTRVQIVKGVCTACVTHNVSIPKVNTHTYTTRVGRTAADKSAGCTLFCVPLVVCSLIA